LGARISDALTHQDRQAADDILQQERLLPGDKMNLLLLLGRVDEAADIAFILLERGSLDEAVYALASPVLLGKVRRSGVLNTYQTLDSYNSRNTSVFTSGHRLGGLTLDMSFYQEARNTVNFTRLTGAPDETGGEFAIQQSGNSDVNIFKFYAAHSLNTQLGLSLNHIQSVGSRFKLDTLLAYNQAADENAALRIVGRRHILSFEGRYNMDSMSQLTVAGGYHQYRTIDGQALGSGTLISGSFRSQLGAAHPGLSTRVTALWNRYKTATGILNGDAATLIPSGEPKSPNFLMPQDVSEVAGYLSMGDANERKLPARSFVYESEFGVFGNLSGSAGFRASAGIAARVIGADRLQLSIRYDQSPGGQGFSNLLVDAGYQIFY
jgi:hypothetical protein